MKRNMHAKTIALVLVAITGMQAGGIVPNFDGNNIKAYADTIVKEEKQSIETTKSKDAYKAMGIDVNTTTAGSITVTLPSKFTNSLDSLDSKDNTAYIAVKFTTPSGINPSKIKDLSSSKEYVLSSNSNEVKDGCYIKYIPIATKNGSVWNPITETCKNDLYKYEWFNENGVAIKTSLNTTVQREKYATVSISGSEKVGKTLEAKAIAYKNGKITNITNVDYEWQRCKKKDGSYDKITSGKDKEYKLRGSDEDKYVKVIAKVTIDGEIVTAEDIVGRVDEKKSSRSHSSSSKGSGSTADTDRINDKIEDSKADSVSYNVSNYPKVEKDVFECLKDNDDKTLVLEGDDYTWTFDGDDIKNVSSMDSKLDTTIETTSPNESEIKNILNGANVVNLYFSYDGKLPGKAKIEAKIGSKYNGKNMYVYYYNKSTKSLELVASNVKVKDDRVSFTITHCSDYVLSETPLLATSGFKEGWNTLNNGSWQYVLGGNKVTGWNFINSKWYYMDSFGIMQKGWVNPNGSWYYLNYNGDMATGWQNINGNWYYLRDDGKMLTGWIDDRGTWYYLDYSGAMLSNTTVNGYRLGSNGAWIR
ncbi:N-acetylmuramoyl-L-alanine amidase family protein [Clostridium botulinum]|uniref:N-acetylmuramoyl-L-alanine amidase family protein n=1 Tax=Clostridium botulinum TaxID=1491 RepID=A0A6B4JJX8_CLOBO|nr:N-acetylmuramoyl-L-alanine amidase family protein [Clostridium botulinum]EES48725.1 cell wall binding repeat protein [Clostridium botulinum E1 str. 'BoNT E Beluga']MBY6760279.1 N-acetylmuramoyl-L-alanine amidase family protein [Clostridium botulinum]MBY6919186.1 N-acetylmuramoyl-L-alanine amidase family protein [Clostridium botulinum]MCR1130063.1 N-acetylmuramoyl-L-alanine amidase family protein [Clostridium botulinum]NFJ57172.1 N-acetylmuramoyl-L-alanine amidase family protein [Clostridium